MSEQEKTELDLLREENERLRAKLKSFEKGTKREVFDINAVSARKELLGGLYTIQSYGPCGDCNLLQHLGTIVRHVIFSDQKVEKERLYKGTKTKIMEVLRLSDLSDTQYQFYLLAQERIYDALAKTVSEYRSARN